MDPSTVLDGALEELLLFVAPGLLQSGGSFENTRVEVVLKISHRVLLNPGSEMRNQMLICLVLFS